MRLFLNTTRIMSKKHRVLNLNLSDYLHNPFNSQLKKKENSASFTKGVISFKIFHYIACQKYHHLITGMCSNIYTLSTQYQT